ncbi:hypothetical protein CF15_00275 [Pyrodictium occultum]|uniref:Uncharacterized protein n=1 Tax=Pyrodictium occultum TaxID=2309 RepID=A0A0V8RTD5_PYROC|nr:ketopantoate reductase C-terminal domain-containing protein [Pyrodictium occultum]KSW11344.1 hypothetical protein CF15_00275 [Pyrodictium occultum]
MGKEVAVAGCGPVGLFLAAGVAYAGYTPVLLCLSSESAAALLQREIRVHYKGGEARARASVAHILAARRRFQHVIVAARLNYLDHALEAVKRVLEPSGGVVFVQPSPYVLELASSRGLKVYGAIALYTCVRKIGPGEIEWPGEGAVRVAAGPGAEHLADMMALPGVPIERVGGRVTQLLWDYSIAAASLQPLSALLGLPYSRVWRLKHARELALRVAEEAGRVAEETGTELWRSPREALEELAEVKGCVPRMLQDVSERRETEADYMLGYLLGQALRRDLYTPYIDSLYLMVKSVEESMRSV